MNLSRYVFCICAVLFSINSLNVQDATQSSRESHLVKVQQSAYNFITRTSSSEQSHFSQKKIDHVTLESQSEFQHKLLFAEVRQSLEVLSSLDPPRFKRARAPPKSILA